MDDAPLIRTYAHIPDDPDAPAAAQDALTVKLWPFSITEITPQLHSQRTGSRSRRGESGRIGGSGWG